MILVGFLSALIVVAATFQPIKADSIVAKGCGKRPLSPAPSHVSSYVVGGYEVEPEFSFPWMCSLHSNRRDRHFCGCSLIKNLQGQYYVLTAAHCTRSNSVNITKAVVGAHNISDKTEPSRQTLRFHELFVHPRFDYYTMENDIAIFSLKNQPVENDYVQPVCIPNTKHIAGFRAFVTGWGRIKRRGRQPDVLLEAQMPVLSDFACTKAYRRGFYPTSMMCAGFTNGGVDSCQGDSGGPLVVKKDGAYQQVGVVSWGFGCADKRYPGVYADVHDMRDWINKIINT